MVKTSSCFWKQFFYLYLQVQRKVFDVIMEATALSPGASSKHKIYFAGKLFTLRTNINWYFFMLLTHTV